MRTIAQFLLWLALTLSGCSRSSAEWIFAKPRTETQASGTFRVSVTTAQLDPARDELGFVSEHGFSVAKLHGKRIYGTEGHRPTIVVRRVAVHLGAKRYALPSACYDDLAEVELDRWNPTVSKEGDHVVVTLHGSDGAGSYTCRWHISPSRLEVSRSITEIMGIQSELPAQRLVTLRIARQRPTRRYGETGRGRCTAILPAAKLGAVVP